MNEMRRNDDSARSAARTKKEKKLRIATRSFTGIAVAVVAGTKCFESLAAYH